MIVYVLVGGDDYSACEILQVYSNKETAEKDIRNKVFEKRQSDGSFRLISRQGSPTYRIVEKELVL